MHPRSDPANAESVMPTPDTAETIAIPKGNVPGKTAHPAVTKANTAARISARIRFAFTVPKNRSAACENDPARCFAAAFRMPPDFKDSFILNLLSM